MGSFVIERTAQPQQKIQRRILPQAD